LCGQESLNSEIRNPRLEIRAQSQPSPRKMIDLYPAGVKATVANRDANLDLLRAAAIATVVAYHLVLRSPTPLPRLMKVATYGQYGVDLFFALSGWLIGSLYWKEHARFGDVDLLRFWSRRWLRTIPPYLLALALAWLAVWIHRREAFDWGYLVFIQNYRNLSYFIVSWSLCIEEHFYFFLPLLLVWGSRTKRSVVVFFTVLILVAPVCRWLQAPAGITNDNWGMLWTATHLRMEGLLLGFLAAYLPGHVPGLWSWLRLRSSWLMGLSLAGLATIVLLPDPWVYRLGLSALALGMTGLMVVLVSREPGRIAASMVVNRVAVTSYSVYLTHSLLIDVVRQALDRAPALPWLIFFPLSLGVIAAGGAAFYLVIERTSIQLRDRCVPRRKRVLGTTQTEPC
jgi:peptidoglycan/LPS O-acetylase OafA/YrhL